MRKSAVLFLGIALLVIPSLAASQIYPPKPGVEMPQAYFDRIKEDPTAFQFRHAWIQKAERIRKNRQIVHQQGANAAHLAPTLAAEGTAVSGTTHVPVFMVKFLNTGANPYPSSNLQTELFDGPWATGTMNDFYDEISYGLLNLTGTVYDWFQLSHNDTYYEGTQNGLGADSKVGYLLKETLDHWDPTVDFGQYDNDGPDGVPNSGDDDGYVDFVSFVHAEYGGECGSNSNIWSHRWYYGGWWGGVNYTTNDPRTGGGYIKVADYTIQPALACDGSTMIQIGVFCHEFGHAFGLPDLYDTNGGSEGIGHWGLMGSGNWNKPQSPSHMCAWSKSELGWVVPITVGPVPTLYSIHDIETNDEAYALPIYERRWRRSSLCALAGSYSLHMGLNATEASARGWPGGAGYGNGWDERVVREFTFDGSTPVTLSYQYAYSTESGYDYAYTKIEVNGTEYSLRSYNGTGAGTEAGINLGGYLSGSGASTYKIIFEFTSDIAYSDEDGNFNAVCGGPFTVDNVGLAGGGETYFTNFETYEDGWHEEIGSGSVLDAGVDEYFLVENRQPNGFDQFVHGAGLAIWHVNESVVWTALGNTGGSSGNTTHGLQLMEADGLWNLMNGTNRGDGGDIYPGSTSNTVFDNASTPSSLSSENEATNVAVSSISAPSNTMTAIMRAGNFPPGVSSILPVTGDNGTGVIPIPDLLGSNFLYGATFLLRDSLGGETPASTVAWVGYAKLSGTIDLTGALPGRHDVVVVNPDGQEGVLPKAFTVTGATGVEDAVIPQRYALYQNHPNPFNPVTTIPFDLKESSPVKLNIYDVEGRLVRRLIDGVLDASHYEYRWDGLNDAGEPVSSGIYFYRLATGHYTAVKKMLLLK
jgi:M6 family metalloprotease-like protein